MKEQSEQSRKSRGFTLVEILIAILIVGIIASAVVPMISDYSERAKVARLLANAGDIDKAMARYELEHKAPLGHVYDAAPSPPAYVEYQPGDAVGIWRQLLNPTDVSGNVQDDPATASPGPYVLGPYFQGETEGASLLLAAGGALKERRCGVIDVVLVVNVDGSADLTVTYTPSVALGGSGNPVVQTTHFASNDPSPRDTFSNAMAQPGLKATEKVSFWTNRRVLGASVMIRGSAPLLAGQRPVAPLYSLVSEHPEITGASLLLAGARAP